MRIFFSYSHKDEALCNELQKHLSPLKKADLITQWYDREIIPGENWDEKIKENLLQSDLILFLVSPDFLSSDYIYEKEIKEALNRHRRGEAIVVPIMLRKCDIEYTQFKDIQGLPTDMEPINSKKWYSIDDACFDVVEGLKKIIKQQKKKKEALSIKLQQEIISSDKSNAVKQINLLKKFLNFFKRNEEEYYNNIKLNTELIFLKSEMQEISMEIHDDIGAQLSVVRLYTSILEKEVQTDEIKKIGDLVSNSINSLRQISQRLSHGDYDIEFNLKQALLELESYFIKITNIRFIFTFSNLEKSISQRLEINIFRIIQELLNNVIKHSKATACNILVKNETDTIIININDNGIGFLDTPDKTGMGIENIRSRVKYYTGDLSITSEPNQGTKIIIVLPAK